MKTDLIFLNTELPMQTSNLYIYPAYSNNNNKKNVPEANHDVIPYHFNIHASLKMF